MGFLVQRIGKTEVLIIVGSKNSRKNDPNYNEILSRAEVKRESGSRGRMRGEVKFSGRQPRASFDVGTARQGVRGPV